MALFVQAAGGGIASSADDDKGSALGANIMLGKSLRSIICTTNSLCIGGIVFQLG